MSVAAYNNVMAMRLAEQQRLQRATSPHKVGQAVLCAWCGAHGTVVDVGMAADLVRRIEAAIVAERASLSSTGSTTP